MVLAHCERSNQKQLFEDFMDTIAVEVQYMSRVQRLLSDARMVLQYMLANIQNAP